MTRQPDLDEQHAGCIADDDRGVGEKLRRDTRQRSYFASGEHAPKAVAVMR